MTNNHGEKMPPYEGGDGKLYYNFAQGLKTEMHGSDRDRTEDYTLTICDCHYIGNTEYYDVERNGVPLPQPLSANRVKYLLSRYGVNTLNVGEREELPLTMDEVKNFYLHLATLHDNAERAASQIAEYVATRSALASLHRQLGIASAYDKQDEINNYSKQIEALERRSNEILNANGINPAFLEELPYCPECGGRGYVYNRICSCVISRTDEIKKFCADERLKFKKFSAPAKK